ncbi:response regulator [Mesorhizobium sp. B3-2-1]|nr:response regulator [Mesorhizobium sp. B3-2-1]
MIVYLIEDDELKAARISSYLAERINGSSIERFRSYQSGLKAVESKLPDLIILDMTIPTFDPGPRRREGRPRSMGGRDLMRKMARKGRTCPVVIVTQFESFGEADESVSYDQLKAQCELEFPQLFRGMAHYHATSNAWEAELDHLIGGGQ